MRVKKIITILLALTLIFALTACKEAKAPQDDTQQQAENTKDNTKDNTESNTETESYTEGEHPMVTITMENGGVMKLELYPEKAPLSVANFVKLAKKGFYDGLTFHRIISGFMIQGGDPEGTGMGGSDETIKGEFSSNGVENDLSHVRGVISMARSNQKDSASSQFFICHDNADFLDGEYAAFGMMTEGFDVLDELAKTPVTDSNGTVLRENQPIIKSITIE